MGKEKELRDKLGNLQTELDEIRLKKDKEKRNFTKEELTEIDRLMSQQDLIINELKELNISLDHRNNIPDQGGYESEINTTRGNLQKMGFAGGIVGAESYGDVFGKQSLSDDGFNSLGEFMTTLRAGFQDKRLRYGRFETPIISSKNKRTAQEAVPSDGGFFLPTQFAAPIIDNMIRQGELIKRCQIFGLQGSNSIKIPAWAIPDHSGTVHTFAGGLVVSRMNEGGQTTATSPKIRQIQMTLNKLTALCTSSNELISDAIEYGTYLTKLISDAMQYVVEFEIVNGNGAGEILGLKNSPSKIEITKETGQDADTIVLENIYGMLARFWRGFKNAVWLANQDCEEQLKTLVVGTSGDLARWSYDVNRQTLEGIPLIWTEHCPALGDAADIILTDLSTFGLALAGAGQVQIATSEHIKFDYDQTMFRGVYRNDGQSLMDAVYTPKHGDTKSNIVTIEARA